ncbi:hypothetical protein [Neobacillus notoginsengisoli]|uniref:hypothetical protein n=1 Tax=Neobacillus notoginsengisoli TaxID=1578198 RepID=UPI00131496CE|nr:hypothetical protein [Neobacillus notoginsengisoli]
MLNPVINNFLIVATFTDFSLFLETRHVSALYTKLQISIHEEKNDSNSEKNEGGKEKGVKKTVATTSNSTTPAKNLLPFQLFLSIL